MPLPDPNRGDGLVEAAFLAAYEAAAALLFERLERACRREEGWPQRLRAAVGAVLALFAEQPDLARLLLLGPYEAGEEALRRHRVTLERLAGMLREGRELTEIDLPEILEEGLIGGAVFVLSRPLQADGAPDLPALAPELTALLLTPYLGREEAERVAAG